MAAVPWGGKEVIPDGTGSREGMFSARFDGKETERLFRQVYKILKDLNYSVLMVEEGAGGDFGDSTAIFLGRLRKRKGVMLSVCSWHYGEITNSKYSSYEEVKFAHGHDIDILPLRVCDDPWPPEPPSGPGHPYDKEGKAEGLLALAIPPSQIYVDCRGKDARWIAARIAEKLCQKPAEGADAGGASSSTLAGPIATALRKGKTGGKDSAASTADAAATAEPKAAGFLPSPPTAASTGPEAKGAHPGASSSTPQGPIAAALPKGMAGSKDLAASVADAAATAEPKAQGSGEEAKALVPSASPSPADVKEAEAFWDLGRKGGGERNGQSYSKKACFLKVLELNENYANAWCSLGACCGGTVKGQVYDAKACYVKAVEVDENYALAWRNLGRRGGGTVKGQAYAEKACYVKAVEVDENDAIAWCNLGLKGGGAVKGQAYDDKACYVKTLELDETYALAWCNLGLKGGGAVKGQSYDAKDCFVRVLELNENDADAWRKLGDAGGGTVRGTHYGPDDCKAKAQGK